MFSWDQTAFLEILGVINGVRFQLSALLDLKKKAIQGAFFVHD